MVQRALAGRDAAAITLAGGRLNTGGFSETLGTLTLTGALTLAAGSTIGVLIDVDEGMHRCGVASAEDIDKAMVLGYGPGFDETHPMPYAAKTPEEADNLIFSALTHNPAALHLDEEYMKGTEFGSRIVNSCFTLSLMVGVSVGDTTLGTTIANLGWDEVRFPKPVYPGDTLRTETLVHEMRESRSRPDAGIVVFVHRCFNQRGEGLEGVRRAQALVPMAVHHLQVLHGVLDGDDAADGDLGERRSGELRGVRRRDDDFPGRDHQGAHEHRQLQTARRQSHRRQSHRQSECADVAQAPPPANPPARGGREAVVRAGGGFPARCRLAQRRGSSSCNRSPGIFK